MYLRIFFSRVARFFMDAPKGSTEDFFLTVLKNITKERTQSRIPKKTWTTNITLLIKTQ